MLQLTPFKHDTRLASRIDGAHGPARDLNIPSHNLMMSTGVDAQGLHLVDDVSYGNGLGTRSKSTIAFYATYLVAIAVATAGWLSLLAWGVQAVLGR